MANNKSTDSDPLINHAQTSDGKRAVVLIGVWNLRRLKGLLHHIIPQLKKYSSHAELHWDLTQVSVLDQAGAILLWRSWGGKRPRHLTLKDEHNAFFERIAALPQYVRRPRRINWTTPFTAIGNKIFYLLDHVRSFTELIGRVVLDIFYLAREPGRAPWKELSASIYRTGTQALGITALVGFLIGVVLSYLSAKQLRLFGADIYIVNILGISIFRELGPVLAAILVAGRSGSSITAQLGVMRVTQELDALAVMGIHYGVRLVMPKIIALTLAMPLLVLWTNSIALLGGAISAQFQVDISVSYFISALPEAVPIANFWLGIGKGAVFGFLIALIACHFGLRIRPNTESLGEGTTSSVVTAITVVILADAVFAVIFADIGIM